MWVAVTVTTAKAKAAPSVTPVPQAGAPTVIHPSSLSCRPAPACISSPAPCGPAETVDARTPRAQTQDVIEAHIQSVQRQLTAWLPLGRHVQGFVQLRRDLDSHNIWFPGNLSGDCTLHPSTIPGTSRKRKPLPFLAGLLERPDQPHHGNDEHTSRPPHQGLPTPRGPGCFKHQSAACGGGGQGVQVGSEVTICNQTHNPINGLHGIVIGRVGPRAALGPPWVVQLTNGCMARMHSSNLQVRPTPHEPGGNMPLLESQIGKHDNISDPPPQTVALKTAALDASTTRSPRGVH